MSEYCPHHTTCPFYQNWTRQTGDRRTDVIILGGIPGEIRYDCLALMAVIDSATEGGINIGDSLKGRVSKLEDTHCSQISLLNMLHRTAFPNAVK